LIESIKELEKLLKICRRQGVTELKFGGTEFKLGELPQSVGSTGNIEEQDPLDPLAGFPTGDLTPEQLMFYSAGGLPQDDPALKDEH
jgi:hypothetical protein